MPRFIKDQNRDEVKQELSISKKFLVAGQCFFFPKRKMSRLPFTQKVPLQNVLASRYITQIYHIYRNKHVVADHNLHPFCMLELGYTRWVSLCFPASKRSFGKQIFKGTEPFGSLETIVVLVNGLNPGVSVVRQV